LNASVRISITLLKNAQSEARGKADEKKATYPNWMKSSE
jgi:hypothetical protein